MKQMLKTGKKALSVFMAIMMLMTAWVWVAPTEASAATAGKYYVRFTYDVDNKDDDNGGEYTGSAAEDKNGMNITYTKQDGTTGKYIVSLSGGTSSTGTKTCNTHVQSTGAGKTCTAEMAGLPTNIVIHVYGSSTDITEWYLTKVEVSSSSDFKNDLITLWSGKAGSHVQRFNGGTATITVDIKNNSVNSSGVGTSVTTNSTNNFDGVPVASEISFISGDESLTIPKTGASNVTKIYTAGVYDQYGVRMTHEPTYYVRSTAPTSAQSSSSTITGVSMSSGTSSGTMTVTSSAQNTSADTKNVYVHAKYGSVYANKTVTLSDPTYTYSYNKNTSDSSATIAPSANTTGKYYNMFGDATISGTRTGFTFKGFYPSAYSDSYETVNYSGSPLSSTTRYTNDTTWYAAWQANQYSMSFKYRDNDGQWVTSDPVTEYYGRNIPFPTVISPVNDGVDYTYTFTGWSPAQTSVQDVDGQVYTAVYDEEVHYADKTNLNKAIAVAEAKLNEQQYIDGGYTEESVAAFESALQQADDALGMLYYLSQQSALDLITNSLVTATNNLTTKKYIVMFVDEDGTILKDGYHFVEYGKSVTVPANPEQEPDADYHYEFVEWNSNLSDGLAACNYVTDNLRYIAKFDAIPHTFTETTTPSTCTADGVITYTCDCGYSYTAVNSADLAHHTWSTDYKELLPATCATKGSEAKYCTACGAIDESTRREIAELGHAFGAYTEYTPATCFGKGSKVAECSRCQALDVIEIPQLSHQYGNAEKVEMTCIADGYTKETCSICGFVNIRDIEKTKGHALKVETVPETCVSIGYAKTYCEKCDFERTTVYPATGWHTYPDTWETVAEATCVGHGIEKRVCTVCNSATETRLTDLADHTAPADWTTEAEAWCGVEGRRVKDCTVCGKELDSEAIPALEHNYEAYPNASYPATCTSAGADAEKCSRCGDINTTVIQPSGHKYENEGAKVTTEADCTHSAFITYDCDNCDYTYTEYVIGSTVKAHTWVETEEKAADCENDGYIRYKCSVCDATKETILSKTGHSYGAWEVVKEATNDEDGQWTRTCTKCNDVEELTIPKGGHVWDNGTQTLAPTCTTTGTMVYKCTTHTDCGVTLEAVIPVTQHNVAQRETKATCTKTGSVEAYCEVCGLVLSTEEIPVKAHDFVAQTPVDSTCTTSGYTPYTCACGATYNAYNENDPAKGHDFSVFVSKNDATCTADGKEIYKCSRCDEEQTTVLPKTGHNYEVKSTTSADCTTPATTVYECTGCKDSYTEYDAAANGHTWSDWTETQAATADNYGIKERTCSVCGAVEIDKIAPIGDHVFTETVTKPATCTEDGEKKFICSVHTNCTADYTAKIPATGHDGEIAYTAPTCTEEGSTKIICKTCGATVGEETVIPVIAHSYSSEVTLEAGCATTGTKTYTCSCGDSYTETIPAKGHELTTVVNDATCDKAGSVVITCANCNDPAVEKTVELAAKGHIWKDTYESKIDATCETDGSETYKCQFCDEKNVVVIPKLGHNWGEWEVTKASTNTETGELKRTCSRGCTETAEIPAGGHELVIDAAKSIDASCSAEGTLVYKCNNHADCGITVSVSVPKTQHTVAQRERLATCTKTGSVEAYCEVCGLVLSTEEIPVKAHDFVAQTPVASTCTTSGYTPYTCSCGATYNAYNENEKATGHNYVKVENSSTATCTAEGTITLKCSVCNNEINVDVPALGHDYVEDKAAATEATCAAAATKTYKCSRCTASYTISEGDKLTGDNVHSWGAWTVKESATPTSLGYQTRTCSLCGKLEVKTLEATGEHQFETGDITESEAATCTENGYEIRKCTVHADCGKTATIVIPATGHDEVVNTVDATCEGEGTVITTCKNCDYKEVEAIAELGHLYEAGTGAVTPATCDAEGKIEYTCTRCNGETKTVIIPVDKDAHNYKTTVEQATCVADGSVVTECLICGVKTTETIPATGHSWNSGSVSKEATCEEAGLRTLTCLKCAATSDEVIPALGHTYEAGKAVAPTCTTSGYTVYTCKNDSAHTYKVYDEAKPATGHTWSDWSIDTNATETTEGLKIRTCTCGETDEQIIPAMMHDMEKIESVASTCSQAGHITYKCKIDHEGVKCSYTLTVDLPLVAHALKTTVTEASCKDSGSVLTECTVCDYETIEALALKPHKLTVTTTAATCEGEGSVVEKCKVCGETKTTTIAALGHDFSGKETIVTPASCSDDGKKTIGCTRCDAVKEIIIPQTAHNFEPKEVVAATCTTSGYTVNRCACGREYNALDSDPIGHSWNKGEITKDATCTTDGEKTFTCTRDNCGATRTEVISKFGHSWGAWEVVVNPTATVDGLQMRKCLRGCGVTDSVVIPALGGTTTYTVTFVADGKVIATQTVVHGGSATAPEIGNKAPDANGHYSFIWDTDFTKVTEDLTVTAVYTQAAHNYGEWITDIEATCKAQGKQHRVCADCSYTQTQTVAVKSHDYSVVKSEKEATCTESGYTVRACSYCGTTTTETTMRLGHTMTYHEYIPETCDTDGSMAYYSCSRCGKNFADRLGKTELTDIVISKKYHTFIVSEGKDPTCTAEGVTDYLYCTSCGFTQNPSSIPALGHVDANKDNACDRCGGTYMEGGEIVCTCNCHKSGIFNELIYKILLFFWRLFGMNKSCACGRVHY